MDLLFESTAYAHPIDEIYEGQPAQIGEVEVNPNAANQMSIGSILGVATTMLPLVIIAVLLYLVLIRPQRKSEKQTKEMVRRMKAGDEAVTVGGICGRVMDIKDDLVYIEIGNTGDERGTLFLKVERDSIKSVRSGE